MTVKCGGKQMGRMSRRELEFMHFLQAALRRICEELNMMGSG